MKKIFIIMLITSSPSFCQVNNWFHFEGGMSLLTGYAFDIGFGKTMIDTGYNETGIVFLGSIWQPYWGNHYPDGEEGYFSWFTPTTQAIQKTGFSLGAKYIFDKFGIGMTFDFATVHTYQNYVSSVTSTTWHTPAVETSEFGISGTIVYKISDKLWLTAFCGNIRPLMIGIVGTPY